MFIVMSAKTTPQEFRNGLFYIFNACHLATFLCEVIEYLQKR